MSAYSELVQKLVKELSFLPGIGPRSAERIVFYLLKSNERYVSRLSELLLQVKERVFFCEACNNLSESTICRICQDETRNHKAICVVEEPKEGGRKQHAREGQKVGGGQNHAAGFVGTALL